MASAPVIGPKSNRPSSEMSRSHAASRPGSASSSVFNNPAFEMRPSQVPSTAHEPDAMPGELQAADRTALLPTSKLGLGLPAVGLAVVTRQQGLVPQTSVDGAALRLGSSSSGSHPSIGASRPPMSPMSPSIGMQHASSQPQHQLHGPTSGTHAQHTQGSIAVARAASPLAAVAAAVAAASSSAAGLSPMSSKLQLPAPPAFTVSPRASGEFATMGSRPLSASSSHLHHLHPAAAVNTAAVTSGAAALSSGTTAVVGGRRGSLEAAVRVVQARRSLELGSNGSPLPGPLAQAAAGVAGAAGMGPAGAAPVPMAGRAGIGRYSPDDLRMLLAADSFSPALPPRSSGADAPE